jgi:hypothetical protein
VSKEPTMQRSSRKAWVVLCMALVGCSLATDFPRDKIPDDEEDGGPSDAGMLPDAIVDGSPGMDARPDTGMDAAPDAVADAAGDTGETGPVNEGGAECTDNAQCPPNQLCCSGLCVNTSVATQCTACGVGCSAVNSNTCNNRTCGCDNAAACGAGTPYCVANDAGLSSCVECDQGADCANRSDGKTLCVGGRCAACDPMNNSGCMGTTPICDGTSLTCVKCTMGGNDNCPGSTVCTSSGACGGCAVAADCVTPTAPICDTAATPTTMCVACSGDNVCAAQIPARPLCASDGRCGVCKPVDGAADPGCDITSATPSCRTNGGAQYTCMRCNANAQCAGGGVRNICNTAQNGGTAGKCVQCTLTAPCANNTATPFCGGDGLCQSCMAAGNAAARNLFCMTATIGARPICDTSSGRCVECTGNQDCGGSTPACKVDSGNPSNNNCVPCTSNAQCSGTTPICNLTTNMCRGCAVATEPMDCMVPTPATPACGPAGACVVCRRGGASACTGVNGTCSASNTCVDCFGATEGCAAGEQCKSNGTPMCVDCVDNNGCGGATPQCDTTANRCQPCLVGSANTGCMPGKICVAGSGGVNACVTCNTNPPPTSQCAAMNCKTASCVAGECSYADAPIPEDGLTCTTGKCNPDGTIEHTPNNGACSNVDGLACTVPTCDPIMGAAPSGCREVPNNALCEDPRACIIGEMCVAGVGCTTGMDSCMAPATCQAGGCVAPPM